MKRYLEVMCPENHMNTVKTICKLANKVDVTPLEYRIIDPKGRALHYTYLELTGKKKHVMYLIKSLSSYGK